MEEGKKRLATFVGINYFNTPKELFGCINDVLSMEDLICARFGFEEEYVSFITDEPESKVQPTGANIRRLLRDMVDKAKTGDVLFFHFSGHGTLVTPEGGQNYEAIVPVDFNLITNADFRELVDRLPPGVSFTIVSDSCNSGGLIDKEKEQIGPSRPPRNNEGQLRPDLLRAKMIPYEDILQHLSSLSGVESEHIGDHLIDLFGDDASSKFTGARFTTSSVPVSATREDEDGGILLSACQGDEVSYDVRINHEAAYGAFSNSIQSVMKEEYGEGKKINISNREVVLRSRKLLGVQGFDQHPCLYCTDENADAPFLQ